MHFVTEPRTKVQNTPKTPEEFADMLEEQIRKMMEDGEEYGEIRIDIPDNLTPEDAAKFIEEIIKRFNSDDEDYDDE